MKITFNEPFKGFGGMYVEEINWSTDGEVTIGGALTRDIAPSRPYDKLILNPPATIIIWNDGTKTVVKCTADELYNPEKGVALCFMKKYFPNVYRKVLNEVNEKYQPETESSLEAAMRKVYTGLYNSLHPSEDQGK